MYGDFSENTDRTDLLSGIMLKKPNTIKQQHKVSCSDVPVFSFCYFCTLKNNCQNPHMNPYGISVTQRLTLNLELYRVTGLINKYSMIEISSDMFKEKKMNVLNL